MSLHNKERSQVLKQRNDQSKQKLEGALQNDAVMRNGRSKVTTTLLVLFGLRMISFLGTAYIVTRYNVSFTKIIADFASTLVFVALAIFIQRGQKVLVYVGIVSASISFLPLLSTNFSTLSSQPLDSVVALIVGASAVFIQALSFIYLLIDKDVKYFFLRFSELDSKFS